jgi:hypothetical protein
MDAGVVLQPSHTMLFEARIFTKNLHQKTPLDKNKRLSECSVDWPKPSVNIIRKYPRTDRRPIRAYLMGCSIGQQPIGQPIG